MHALAVGLVVGSFVWWTLQALLHARTRLSVPLLADLDELPLEAWPGVSMVIPARNEAEHLESALETKLADGYPHLQIVVVDDRSTDATGAIADAVAARDPRVAVVHLATLPPDWLGKLHALHQGLEHATGEWILFSDADLHVAPGTLTKLISWAERTGVDHVVGLPSVQARGFVLGSVLGTFFRLFTTLLRLWKVPDPKSAAAVGAGAFSLFRRRSLDRSPGLEWLKMETSDDVALGIMLKRAGARQALVIARDHLSMEFYPSFSVLLRALEKNGAAAPMPLIVAVCLFLVGLEPGFLAAAFLGAGWPLAAGLVTMALAIGTQLSTARWIGLPMGPVVVPWFGAIPLSAILARAAILAWWRGGVLWRGTLYPTAQVRAGTRMGRWS